MLSIAIIINTNYANLAINLPVSATSSSPTKSINKVRHVLLEEPVDDPKGVFIGGSIKIQGAPKEVVERIGDEKLIGRRRVAAHIEEDAAHSIRRFYDGLVNGTSLISVLKSHLEGVFPEVVKCGAWLSGVRRRFTLAGRRADLFVADIDPGAEPWKVDIDPIRVFRLRFEKARIPHYVGIYGILKGIRVAGLVESLILVGREIYSEIALSFGGIDVIAGEDQGRTGKEQGRRQASGYNPLFKLHFIQIQRLYFKLIIVPFAA
jgi:hypothetical protein